MLLFLSLILGLLPPAAAPDACATPLSMAAMHCVAGGNVVVGDGDARRAVDVPRFFVDKALITVGDYSRCVKADACDPLEVSQGGVNATAILSFGAAERACAFFGKRLPSEAEWEAAAQRKLFAGDVVEWTRTWFIEPHKCASLAAPLVDKSEGTWAQALCGSRDRLDPCDGAAMCGSIARRVMKDPAAPTSRLTSPGRGTHRKVSARCATDTPYLTRFPPKYMAHVAPRPDDPRPPSTEELRIAGDIEQDVLDTPPCDKPGRSFADCRDPRSYLKTNEPRLEVLVPYVKNLGGGYTGVGSDQNYTLIAHARSAWAWLFDYDENVVRWHHVLHGLILQATTPAEFVAFFDDKGSAQGILALRAAFPGDPDLPARENLLRASAPSLRSYYRSQATSPDRKFTWLGNEEHYSYIRILLQQGRLRALKGNMLATHTMQGIGRAARSLKVPLRIYYPSNAAEFWSFNGAYRQNVRALPFDDRSIVVQTISGMKSGFDQRGYWHYNIQYGLEQQKLLALSGYTRQKQLLYHRVKAESGELTLCGLPSE